MGSRYRSLLLGCGFAFTLAYIAGCERDPCLPDDLESPDDEPENLGTFSDAETRMNLPLTLHQPGDVDSFRFDILDEGSDGNPELSLWLSGQADEELTVTVSLSCSSDAMVEFKCDNFDEAFDAQGGSCSRTGRGEIHFDVNYDCEGGLFDSSDGAIATVSVQRGAGPSADAACIAYDLELLTD